MPDRDAASSLLARLWNGYVAIAPQAGRIHELLRARGERFRNDHIALRTYDLAPIGIDVLAEPFLALGWRAIGEYRFEEKRLYARGYVHADPEIPRVFISELRTREFSEALQQKVASIAVQAARGGGAELIAREPSWPPVSVADYEALLRESEYAAWVAAFGIRANHFTVHVNDLRSFASLAELNRFLEAAGFELNGSGTKIQGGSEVLLEQSSTLASRVPWHFAGGVVREIPSCYYEFAKRYVDPATGELYQGFVTASADRIFESTNVRRG
jgi:signal transduction histidine kinase